MATHTEKIQRAGTLEIDFSKVGFAGSDFVEALDRKRLTGQIADIYGLMKDGVWRTLGEIEMAFESRYGQASISAQLRNLRKPGFGSHVVLRRRRGEPGNGLFEYQLLLPALT